MATRMFWSENPLVVWIAGDIMTTFESAIYEDEAHTIPFNLRGMRIKVNIRSDDNYSSKYKVYATIKNLENFEFKFKTGEVPEIGDWKIEFIILQGSEVIGMTHHDDFNVEE